MSLSFMLRSAALATAAVAPLLDALAVSPASAQDNKTKTVAAPERAGDSDVARYCGALAPSATEARAAYQLRRLGDLEGEVRDAVEKLESKELATREWVTRREAMMKSATDDVVAIYAKMTADAAATQLAAMEEPVAAAVLAKLKPQTAGAILAEMQADKAAKLAALIAGAPVADKS